MSADVRMVEVDAKTALERLCGDLRMGREDPVVVARQALHRANRNAGHNTYLWLDKECALQRAASLGSLFPDPFGASLTSVPAMPLMPTSRQDALS